MFAQRFDPEEFTRKRKLEDEDVELSEEELSSSSSSESLDSESESESSSSESESSDSESESDESDESEKEESEKEPIDNPMDVDVEVNREGQEEYESKHSAIFQKMHKTQEIQPQELPVQSDNEELHEIAPMPQPALPRDQRLRARNANNLNWLAKPIYSSPENVKPFDEFSLSDTMNRNLAANSFTQAFSVQVTVLDILLQDIEQNKLKPESNGDLLVNASTGSGKTLAYSIPIIESLMNRVVPRVRAIILVPTKPLINQVKATLLSLSKGTNLYVMSLKNDISIKEEGSKIKNNTPDIIVSTPGRLVDHLISGDLTLDHLRWLVIDEADRLLNQSFQNWCEILISRLRPQEPNLDQWTPQVQKLIFSATLTTDAGKLSLLKFHKPRLVIINEEQELVNEIFSVPKTLSEYTIKYGTSKNSIKPLILSKFLIKNNKLNNVLIFTKSNESSIRLTKLLELLMKQFHQSLNIQFLNSTNNSNQVRSRILKQFDSGDINILVVTDLIARGVDILTIQDVINYDIPKSSREYIHRSGRTARAGNSGNVYNLVFGKGEFKWYNKLMKEIYRKKEIELIEESFIEDGDDDLYKKCLEELQEIISEK